MVLSFSHLRIAMKTEDKIAIMVMWAILFFMLIMIGALIARQGEPGCTQVHPIDDTPLIVCSEGYFVIWPPS